ncbi:MAG: 30S ribosomal protein S9 [Planctomycetes bacterium]|nr:30S ribosomal protein S9 [Planctomycetota bacterium]
MAEGTGRIRINGRSCEEYFPMLRVQEYVRSPLRATKAVRTYDIWATIQGGGVSGQAGAFVMGLGRALASANGEFGQPLRDGRFLTRDARMVERKKYGRKKARKSFQYSKR